MGSNEHERRPAPDLGLLFTTNASDVTADKIFINRDRERLAFDEAVRVHYNYTSDANFDSQDVLTPRRNVQVFYGAGGVGKTSLSRALEGRHGGQGGGDWSKMRRPFKTPIEARIDLASEAGLDLERTLLLIRAAVAKLRHPMHAFDLALSRYWEHVHPDKSLVDFLRADGLLNRVSDAIQLPDQIQEGLTEVGTAIGSSSTLASAASQLAMTLVRSPFKQRARRHAIEGCRRLQPLLEAEPDVESLSYYPHLLSWDLDRLAGRFKGGFHVAVFMDTIEDVARGTHRNFERLLQRLVWLMPNVLFVVSGRNRLDWADSDSASDGGRSSLESWPGLADDATAEPTQHLVGHLSQRDCARFLSLRLRSGDAPLMPEEIRSRIARESQGYPLYLDMAVTRYMQIVGSGAIPDSTDFAGGFPGLISRVLRDLDREERRLARILSLLDSFDTELAVKVADLPSESVANRLAKRTFVDIDDQAPLPYSIHRLVRSEMLRAADDSDAFTAADWSRYAQRAFDYLGERYYRANRVGDRTVANSALNQALRLADQYHLDLGWCTDAAFLFIEDSLWESSVRPLIGPALATPAAALAQTFLAVVNQRMEGRRGDSTQTRGEMMGADLRETAQALNEVLANDVLTGDARDLATYYAAEALRELGRGAEAEELIRSISGRDSGVAGLAAKGLVHRLRRLGRFRELRELIDAQPREAVWLQMAGTLSWSQGLLTPAKEEYKASRNLFLGAGYLGNADELLGCLAFVCGLAGDDGTDNVTLVSEGVATLRTSRNRWATLMAELGAVMLDADGGKDVAARSLAISKQGEAAGLSSIQSYAQLSLCLNAAISENIQALGEAKTALGAHVTAEDFHWLLEIVDFWSDEEQPSSEQQATADWLDGVTETSARWRQVLLNRRSEPPTTRP